MDHLLFAFVPVALLVILTPGPDTVMVVRHATRGTHAGFAAITGVMLGLTVHGTAATVGLSALLAASATAFTVVKLLGAVYLIFLGVRSLLASRRGEPAHVREAGAVSSNAFRQALVCNLLNPKIAVFFVAFIPQFVRHDGWVVGQTAFLALTFIVLTVAWFAVVVAGVARARRLMASEPVRRWIDRVAGTVFVGFGLRLAAAVRP